MYLHKKRQVSYRISMCAFYVSIQNCKFKRHFINIWYN